MKRLYLLLRQALMVFVILNVSVSVIRAQPCIPNTSSVSFNGTSSFIRINSTTGLDITSQLTVEAWIYPQSFAASHTGNSIFCKHSWGSSVYGYVLRCGGNGVLSFNFAGAVGGNPIDWVQALSSEGALVPDAWQHVAGVFDGSQSVVYINGLPVGNTPFTGTVIPSTGYKARIGALADTVWSMSRFFDGYIDEVRVWNRALSQEEIADGMNDHIDPAQQTGLVGYWRLNENTGTLTDDMGAGNNSGTLVNAAWTGQVPFSNNSLPTPTIIWNPPSLVSSYTTGNQWYFGTTLIPGATQQTYIPLQYGYYKVAVSDSFGCSAVSLPFYFNTTSIVEDNPLTVSWTTVPENNSVSLTFSRILKKGSYALYTLKGECVLSSTFYNSPGINLDVHMLTAGIYFIGIIADNFVYNNKFIITK